MKLRFCLLVPLVVFMLSWVVRYAQDGVLKYLSLQIGPVPYHHIQVVRTWVPTYCKNESNACLENVNLFRLHGLWPANQGGDTVPGPCQETNPQLSDVYQQLQPALGKAWPTISTKRTNDEFWNYQWKKHGNCSSDVLEPIDYFNASITQENNINIKQLLSNAGILPSDNSTYKEVQIKNAIKAGIGGGEIYVSCKMFGPSYYLYEIYICINKCATKYISCPSNKKFRGCPATADIKYIKAEGTSVEESPNELI